MVLGGEVEFMGLAEVAQGLVILLAAGLQVRVGEVGQGEHTGAVLRQDGIQLGCVLCQLGLEFGHFGEEGGHVLALLLHLGDFLGDLILHGLPLLGGGDEAPALLVQLQNPVDGGVAVHLLGPKAILHCLGIFFDSLNVQHIYLTPFLVAL